MMPNVLESLHEPLDPARREIRLLVLPAGCDSASGIDVLTCTMKHTSLDDQELQYETISYVWGDSSQRAPISVNGRMTDTTAAAVRALKQVRRVDEERIVWIDAICIDQSNIKERSQQVAMMADIYKSCSQCLICICDDHDSHAGAAFESMHLMVADVRRQTDNLANYEEWAFDAQKN